MRKRAVKLCKRGIWIDHCWMKEISLVTNLQHLVFVWKSTTKRFHVFLDLFNFHFRHYIFLTMSSVMHAGWKGIKQILFHKIWEMQWKLIFIVPVFLFIFIFIINQPRSACWWPSACSSPANVARRCHGDGVPLQQELHPSREWYRMQLLKNPW